MATSQRKILVTSALPYANGPIHLGHMLEYIQTDIWARFQKLRGHECHYICADDAHGTPIMLKARQDGVTPAALVRDVHAGQVEHGGDQVDVAGQGAADCALRAARQAASRRASCSEVY